MASLKAKEIFCFLYSVLLIISGLLLIIFSSILTVKLVMHFKFIPSSSIGPFIVIFMLGIGHLLTSWLGFKGPSREHDFHIISFMVILVLLFASELAVGIWSLIIWDEIDVESIQLMTDSFTELINKDLYKKEWNSMESKLECCGLNGVVDYETKKEHIPISCCQQSLNETCPLVFKVGCKLPLTRYAKGILIDGALMGFCSMIFVGFGVFVFCAFWRALKVERLERAKRLAEQRQSSEQQNLTNTPPTPSAK